MRMVWCLLAFGLLGLSINQLHAGAVPGGGNLQVVGEARNKLIPIALEGFAGEVAGVLTVSYTHLTLPTICSV